jgi:hypothetical protein
MSPSFITLPANLVGPAGLHRVHDGRAELGRRVMSDRRILDEVSPQSLPTRDLRAAAPGIPVEGNEVAVDQLGLVGLEEPGRVLGGVFARLGQVVPEVQHQLHANEIRGHHRADRLLLVERAVLEGLPSTDRQEVAGRLRTEADARLEPALPRRAAPRPNAVEDHARPLLDLGVEVALLEVEAREPGLVVDARDLPAGPVAAPRRELT